MKSFKHFIKSFDVFAQHITLTFYQKRRFSTYTGGLLTISMVILLFLIALNKMNDVVNHKFLASSTTESIKSIPPPIEINNFFAFTFEPAVMNSIQNKRYFDFEITLPIYTRFPNGTQIKDKSRKYPLSYCNSSHFPMFTVDQLNNYGISSWVCPNIPPHTEVLGDYNSPVYKFIQFKISKCGTSPIKRPVNDSCASDDEINNFKFQNGGKIYLNLKFVNNLLNLDDYNQPFTPYIDQINFLIDAPNSYVQKELSLTSLNIQTDDSIFNVKSTFQENGLLHGSIYDGTIFEFGLVQPQNETGRINYASIYFKSNTKDKTFQRKYSNIQDVLQLVGSFWTLFFATFGFLNRFFSQNSFLIKLANSLYLFPSKNPTDNKEERLNRESKEYQEAHKDSPDELYNDLGTIKRMSLFHKQRNNQKFKYSYLTKLKYLCSSKKPDYSIEEINNVVHMALDVNHILKHNNELDKLKHILLTKEQQMLFNFSTKPTFQNVRNRASINFIKYQEKMIKKKKKINLNLEPSLIYENLYKNYLMIKDDNNNVSRKILEILDPEILKIFEKVNTETNINLTSNINLIKAPNYNETPRVSDTEFEFKMFKTDQEIPAEMQGRENVNEIK